jgi:HK97 family phage major capsid protein
VHDAGPAVGDFDQSESRGAKDSAPQAKTPTKRRGGTPTLDATIVGSVLELLSQAGAITVAPTATGPVTPGRSGSMSMAQVRAEVHEYPEYRRGDRTKSWLQDVARVQLNRDKNGTAQDRLDRHARHIKSVNPELRDTSGVGRVDGQGGWGVPPTWLVDDLVGYARAGRSVANLAVHKPLPPGTQSINIPKFATGTTAAFQTADNTSVSNTNLTDENLEAPARTVAGQQVVSLQLLEQSPAEFDEIVIRDLASAYGQQLDLGCLYGTGSNGQVLGLSNVSGIHSLAVSSVDVTGFYSAVAQACNLIETTRFASPEVIAMHPRRWNWLISQLDSQHRPLVVPIAATAANAVGVLADVSPQRIVGIMCGLPVVLDANITTTAGTETGGGTEDVAYVLRASDLFLWERPPTAQALRNPYAAQLSVLLQLYSYAAFQPARYPQSIAEITGLTPPTWN